MYVVVGVVGMAVSALFYYYIEKVMGVRFQTSHSEDNGLNSLFAYEHWNHYCMGLFMYAGYIGGAGTLPKIVGGSGFNAVQAHEILGPLVEPIT